NTLWLWDMQAQENPAARRGHSAWIKSVGFSPDGTMLASAGQDQTVQLWDARPAREALVPSVPTGWVFSLAFAPDGRTVTAGYHQGVTAQWELPSRRELRPITQGGAYVAISPDGSTLAMGREQREVIL